MVFVLLGKAAYVVTPYSKVHTWAVDVRSRIREYTNRMRLALESGSDDIRGVRQAFWAYFHLPIVAAYFFPSVHFAS